MAPWTGPEDQVLYIANDTEIRSFVYPFKQTHGQRLHARIEEGARIVGLDALVHQHKFVWATNLNPGGIFYKDILDRSQAKVNSGTIVSRGYLLISLLYSLYSSRERWMFLKC